MAASRCARSRFRRSVIESLEARRLLAIALTGHTVEENSAHGAIINPANGHAYYLLGESSWQDAEASAVDLGGHLATINDQAEQDWVFNTFNDYHGGNRSLWIGLKRVGTTSQFHWTSGESPGYGNWAQDQPDFGQGIESFVHMVRVGGPFGWLGGQWNDFSSPPNSTEWNPLCGVVEAATPSNLLSTVVGTLSGTNPNSDQSLSFTLLDDAGGAFALDGSDLVVVQPLDHEAMSTVQVTVRGTDQDGNTFDQAFTINVSDVPEAPIDIELSATSVAENEPAGTTVGTFSFTDPDVAASATYSLVSGAGSGSNVVFTIEGNTLKTAMPLDFEDRSEHSIRVRVKDTNGFSFEKTFTIDVTDVIEVPSIRLSSNFADENSTHAGPPPGFIVNPANGHYYRLLEESDWLNAEAAAVSLGGHLVAINDQAEQQWVYQTFEFANGVDHNLWIGLTDQDEEGVFRWTNGDPLAYTHWGPGQPDNYNGIEDYVYIWSQIEPSSSWPGSYWNDVPTWSNPVAPTCGVVELAPGIIGTLSTSNPPHGQPLTYSLLDDAGGKVAIDGNHLVVAAAFDYETTPSVQVTVRGDDGNGHTYDQTFIIHIIDANEAPSSLALSPKQVSENMPPNTTVGVFTASDIDLGDQSTYTLVSGPGSADNGFFSIAGAALKTNVSFDFETTPSYSIRVRATDSGGLSVEKAFVINVLEANDAPQLNAALSPSLGWISENATNPGGTLVKYVSGGISDVDPQALKGIAVTGVSGKISGHWQYTINGTTWLELGSPSESAARLLPINDVAKVRYVPQAGFAGDVQLYFRAWDRTAGSAGGTMNTAGNLGGAKPLSTTADAAGLTIKPVNNKPVLTLSGSLSYVSKAAAVVLAPNATVTDADSANFAGGLLNVHVATGGNAANRLAIGGSFTVDASNNVKLNGVTIGQRTSGGVGTNWLLVKFNANATKAIVQQLVRSITFKTATISPGQRKIVFSVSDGDGGLSDERTKTVNVT